MSQWTVHHRETHIGGLCITGENEWITQNKRGIKVWGTTDS